MANKTGSRQRLLATLEILREHTDDQTHLTGEQIKEHLQEQYEIDSDRRSIREDIKVLSEFGYAEDTSKYAKRDERGAYYVAHPFEDWELKVLIDGVAQTEHFKAETLNHMIDRIIQLTGPAGRELLTDNRPALSDDAPNSDFYLCRNLDDLLNAIKAKKKVRLSYSKLDANKKPSPTNEGVHEVNPYVIAKRGAFYYLLTFKDGDKQLRPFRIDRIRKVEVLEEKRIPPEKLPIGDMTDEIKGYLKNNTDSFTGETISVLLQWNSEPSILYDVFGINNVFTVNKDASIYSIKAQKNRGLYNNLLRLGDKVKLLDPTEVKEEYLTIIKNILHNY